MNNQAPLVLCLPANPMGMRCAMVNRQGSLLHQSEFVSIAQFTVNQKGGWIAPAQNLKGKYGYINEQGEWVVQPLLDTAYCFSDEGLARFQAKKGWGFIDIDGKQRIPPIYIEARAFNAGLAAIKTKIGAHLFVKMALHCF